jgi:uncharacterized protein
MGGYIIFNTFSNSLVYIDDELMNVISNIHELDLSRFDERSRIYIEKLKKMGFLREYDADELKVVAYRFNKLKFSGRSAGFTILTTYDCNFACVYCYQGKMKENAYMTNEIVTLTLKFMKDIVSKNNVNNVDLTFYGGEPLLNLRAIRDISEDLEHYCKVNGISPNFSIITNGYLMTKSVTKELLKYPFTSVQVTLDGLREVHDRRRPLKSGGGTFDKIVENLVNYIDEVNTNVRVNIDKDNIDEVPEFLAFLIDSGLANKISLSFSRTTPGMRCKDRAARFFDELSFAEKYLKLVNEADNLGLNVVDENLSSLTCGLYFGESYVIDPYGKLFKCWDFVGLDELSVGSIQEGFNKNFYDWMERDPLKFNKCAVCVYLPNCYGGCAAKAYYLKGTIHSDHCEYRYYIFQDLLKRYVIKKHGYKFKT